MPPPGITLRPQTDADRDFLCALYASTRMEELSVTDWSEEEKRAFLTSQFEAQSEHYAKHYRGAEFSIVERENVPIGRFYVGRWKSEIRIVDIALTPETRGGGIGTALLQEVLDEGTRTGKAVTIHVERFNPALRLYQRLGFRHVDEHGVYYLMRWELAGAAADQPKTA